MKKNFGFTFFAYFVYGDWNFPYKFTVDRQHAQNRATRKATKKDKWSSPEISFIKDQK